MKSKEGQDKDNTICNFFHIFRGVIFILSLLRLRQPNLIKLLSERYGQTRVK